MKIREGFVSNSSSSSFVIQKKDLTQEQINKIHNFEYWAEKFQLDYYNDGYWHITETKDIIQGFTIMDNFSFSEYLHLIGIKPEVITWDSENDPYDWGEWDSVDFTRLEED
jgi:hypothetical protein